MKRFLHLMAMAFLCGVLVIPSVGAQNRRAPIGSGASTDNRRPNRPGGSGIGNGARPGNNQGRPGGNGIGNGARPGNNQGRPGGHGRPDRPGNHYGNRPDYRPDYRPGNRPDRPGYRPVVPGRPRPGRPAVMAPPPRPYRPIARPWSRPVPPPSWRPYRGCPVIGSILGITFGTALNLSLDYLYNNGYTVDGYGNNVVYLRNIPQMSYTWPDATLYYGNAGLERSQFIYSTAYYDLTRYNSLYNSFMGSYGAPVGYSNAGNGFVATWFGYNNGYISLEFRPMYTSGGQLRYYTTLTFGN